MVGSYVPEGTDAGEWVTKTAKGVTAFYDIDTPVTIGKLAAGTCEYISKGLIPQVQPIPFICRRSGTGIPGKGTGCPTGAPAPLLGRSRLVLSGRGNRTDIRSGLYGHL